MNKRGVQAISIRVLLMALGLAPLALFASVDPAPAPHSAAVEAPAAVAAADPFPVPAGLRDNVAFWRKVFAEWRQNQVALHDMDYPGIIYDVVELQGDVQDSLSDDQREEVGQLRSNLESRLKRIAATDPAELGAEDQALRQRIVDVAGADAVADAYLRVRTQRGVRERFMRGLAHSGRYDAVFRRIFQEAGLPEDLAFLPHVESSFQNHARSSVGATGMWQFTRSAGRTFMTVNNAVDERLDPVASARGAARYLGQAYQQLGDWALAVTSYNHGMQGMARAKAEFGTDFSRIAREYKSRSFGFASRNFYAEFLAARDIASQPERYFPEGVDFERPLRMDSVTLERAAHARDIAARYGVPVRELAALNPAWSSHAGRGAMPIPAKVEVWLPTGTLVAASARNKAMLAVATRKETAPADEVVTQAAPTTTRAVHVVRRGETLSTIAQRYKVDMASLRELNKLSSEGRLLRVGQKLRVRDEADEQEAEDDARVHVVRKGDTASLIAANYGISVAHLLASNQLTKRSVIRPGQRLGIPVVR